MEQSSIETSPAQTSPNLNIADLVNVQQVLRTCASRGAFRADEMSSVGGLYDRFQAFLISTGAINPDTQTQQPFSE